MERRVSGIFRDIDGGGGTEREREGGREGGRKGEWEMLTEDEALRRRHHVEGECDFELVFLYAEPAEEGGYHFGEGEVERWGGKEEGRLVVLRSGEESVAKMVGGREGLSRS